MSVNFNPNNDTNGADSSAKPNRGANFAKDAAELAVFGPLGYALDGNHSLGDVAELALFGPVGKLAMDYGSDIGDAFVSGTREAFEFNDIGDVVETAVLGFGGRAIFNGIKNFFGIGKSDN